MAKIGNEADKITSIGGTVCSDDIINHFKDNYRTVPLKQQVAAFLRGSRKYKKVGSKIGNQGYPLINYERLF